MNSVFVSSTYKDLRDIRGDIFNTILNCECFPYGMEYFPPSSLSSWTTIKKFIDQSDYFILILAGRYGDNNTLIEPESYYGMSYTEMEFEYALSKNKYIIPLIREKEFITLDTIDFENNQKLNDFKNKLTNVTSNGEDKTCRYWKQSEDLCMAIQNGLYHALKVHKTYQPNIYMGPRAIVDDIHSLEDRWENTVQISILNLACQSIIAPEGALKNMQHRTANLFENQLSKGTDFHIILTNPHSYGAYDAARYKINGDDTYTYSLEHDSFDVIPSSVNRLIDYMRNINNDQQKGDITLRLTNSALPYGLMICEYNKICGKTDVIKVDLYAYNTIDQKRPSFYVYRDRSPELFEFYKQNFGKYAQNSLPISVSKNTIKNDYQTLNVTETQSKLEDLFTDTTIYYEENNG